MVKSVAQLSLTILSTHSSAICNQTRQKLAVPMWAQSFRPQVTAQQKHMEKQDTLHKDPERLCMYTFIHVNFTYLYTLHICVCIHKPSNNRFRLRFSWISLFPDPPPPEKLKPFTNCLENIDQASHIRCANSAPSWSKSSAWQLHQPPDNSIKLVWAEHPHMKAIQQMSSEVGSSSHWSIPDCCLVIGRVNEKSGNEASD